MKIEKIQKLKNNKYKIKLDSGDIINTYDDVILNNSLLFNKEMYAKYQARKTDQSHDLNRKGRS